MYSNVQFSGFHEPSLPSRTREETYPDVCIQTADAACNEAEVVPGNHFLPVEENVWKKGLNAFRDHGLYAALEKFAGAEDGGLCQKTAKAILSLCQLAWTLPSMWYPHLQLPIDDATDVYSKTPRWRTAAIRAIAWHHSCQHLAVARLDGVIEIHHFGMQARTHTTLTDHRQRAITDMQWAPHLHNILAVATQDGLLVWYLDMEAVSHSRLTPTWTRLETSPSHRPITSLSWCPYELSVVTCSPCDTAMKLWDIPLATHTNIVRHRGGGVTMVKWSHDGARVFAATPTPLFRVWDTTQWTCEQWTNLASPCTAAAWSPTGETLLFALRNDPALYCVPFPPEGCATPSNAVRCVDMSAAISVHSEQDIVLGTVKDMVWEPSGEKIATIFEDYCAVAIFQVRLSPVVEVVFGHLIPSPTGSQPLALAFQPSNTAAGPVLSIAWSNGRVSTHILS